MSAGAHPRQAWWVHCCHSRPGAWAEAEQQEGCSTLFPARLPLHKEEQGITWATGTTDINSDTSAAIYRGGRAGQKIAACGSISFTGA
jgi:hypothetical protein